MDLEQSKVLYLPLRIMFNDPIQDHFWCSNIFCIDAKPLHCYDDYIFIPINFQEFPDFLRCCTFWKFEKIIISNSRKLCNTVFSKNDFRFEKFEKIRESSHLTLIEHFALEFFYFFDTDE